MCVIPDHYTSIPSPPQAHNVHVRHEGALSCALRKQHRDQNIVRNHVFFRRSADANSEKTRNNGGAMKLTMKCMLDLSMLNQDPETAKALLAEKEPLKAALVRNQMVLVSQAISLKRQTDLTKVALSLAVDYPCDEVPGLYLTIGKNLPDEIFLSAEPLKIWISPEKFRDGVADLTKEQVTLPVHLFKRWLLLCREYTITGRVVKRVQRWDPIEQMYVPCDEPVPGAKVEAFDVDCWWFWVKRDLAGSATTNPDGTFEITFRWCCLLWLPILKPRWVIDPELLRQIVEAIKPHIGPIPPEILKSPVAFEQFLGISEQMTATAASPQVTEIRTSTCAKKAMPISRSTTAELSLAAIRKPVAAQTIKADKIIDKIRPLLPLLPCWPFRAKDCTPDIVLRVTQECEGEVNIIYDETPFQTRWNIPTHLNVTLMANEKACAIPVCEEPPAGNCLKFMWVNCTTVQNIGTSAGPPDLRGYANPGSTDNPFCGSIYVKGKFGAGSAVDYFKVQYAYAGGIFKDLPEDHLLAFSRSYWAPPPGSPPGTHATWNNLTFKPEPVDGKIVYKTLRKAEQENPLPAGWLWGYLWNDAITLFRWNSSGLEGDGLYTLRLTGYSWDDVSKKLVNEQVMKTCDIKVAPEEKVMIRIDNRDANDPVYKVNEDRPCGDDTVHLCTYEPDCDFRLIELVRKDDFHNPLPITPCDVIELTDLDYIVIHFKASVPKNTYDGHLLAYSMYAHWGEDLVFDAIDSDGTIINLTADPDTLIGPTYGQTLAGTQLTDRNGRPPADPEHDRPYWFGGNFKTTIKGSKFTTCAYTLVLRVWKRTIENCTAPTYVHVNWCSYSFTIKKI